MSSKKIGKTSRTGTSTKSRGLGDTVAKVTKATGVDKAVKWLAGEDCGCDERRAKLNAMFRYKKPECLTEGEYSYLDSFFKAKPNPAVITADEQRALLKINNRVFHEQREFCNSCGAAFKHLLNDLKQLYNEYR